MEEAVIQNNSRITIKVDVSVKKVMHVKNIIFGILLRVVIKMESIQQVLWMIHLLFVMKIWSLMTK